MPAGLNLSRSDVDQAVGQAMLDVNRALTKAEAVRDGLLAYSDTEIQAMGYDPTEVTLIKAALSDMDQLWKIYRGAQSLAGAKDFRDNAKKLWGLGI